MEIDRDNRNEPKQAKFLADPNADVKKWDIIIHSPVLEQGVFRSRYLDKISMWVSPLIESKPTDYHTRTYKANAIKLSPQKKTCQVSKTWQVVVS